MRKGGGQRQDHYELDCCTMIADEMGRRKSVAPEGREAVRHNVRTELRDLLRDRHGYNQQQSRRALKNPRRCANDAFQ